MLDIAFIRENPDKVKEGIKNKNLDPGVVDAVLGSDSRRRELIQSIEALRAERNKLNDQLKVARTPELIQQSSELKTKLQELEPELRNTEEEFDSLMLQVPGIPLEEVPVGKIDKNFLFVGRSILRVVLCVKNFLGTIYGGM